MHELWRRRAAILFAWSVIVFSARPALAVQPLRPQIARCIPKISADSATQGAGNVSSTRQTKLEFRWALGDPADQAAAEIAQTNRVEVCWTSQSEGGIARCPGQNNDAWVIYRDFPQKGQLPQPADVANPATTLAAAGTVFTLPLDWDSQADRNKILFIVVNGTVQDGANLLSGQNVNLTAGGLCGMPTRVEPGSPGSITAPAEHFVVYGTPDDFPLPSGWTTKYPGVCDPDAVAACPVTKNCNYSVHPTLGPCVERTAVTFWRGMMPKASEWQRDRIQAGFQFGDRLDPWPNGTAASGSTCTSGQPCPTRLMWTPFDGAGTGGNGHAVSWFDSTIFDENPVIPLSKDAGYLLRVIGHEYFHTFGSRWAKKANDTLGYDAANALFNDVLLSESLPTATGMTMCLPGYPGNPNGATVPATKPCVAAGTLYFSSLPKVDKYLEFPGGNQNFLAPYLGFWFYRYAAEQFAIPTLKGFKAHPLGTTNSAMPVTYNQQTNAPMNLDVRRADEGMDLVGFLMRSLDPSQTSDPCAFSSSPPAAHSAKSRLDCVLKQRLGRGFDDVLFDFHTMLVLKDYVVDDPRWTPEWVGDFNAGATTPLWTADPANGLDSAPAPKAPLRTLRPFVASNGAHYPKTQVDVMPDDLHRATRLLDTYSCADPNCATVNVNRLMPGQTLSSPYDQPLGSYRAAIVSISPDPGWAGSELEVWVEKKKGKPRVRVFTVDTSGVAKLHKQCVLGSPNLADECLESAAYKGKVRVPVKVDSSVHEILVVVSGGADPSSFTWQLGPQASELTIISPTTAKPALIGTPGPFGVERAFLLMFTARDAAGKPYDVVTSANLDVLINGTSIAANCPNSPQNPAPCPFTLMGMSGGSYMAVAQVPSSFYPPQPWPQTVDLEIRLKNGSSSQADLEPDALRVDTAGENLNTMFVIDTSWSMNASGKLDAAKKAAKLIVDAHIDNVDAAGLVMFSSHAQALNGLGWLDPTSRQSLKNGVDSLGAGGATAIGDGLYEAQDQLASSSFGANPVPAVFVLSDGLSMCDWNAQTYYFENRTADGAPDPNDPGCDGNTVPTTPPWNPQGGAGTFVNPVLGFKPRVNATLPTPIITGVGVGPDADMEAIGSLATISGGVSFHVPSVAQVQTLSLDLGDAFRTAINAVSGHERVSTARVTGLAALPTVLVEPGTRELLISVMTSAPDPHLVELLLLDPQSGAVPPERIDPNAHAIFRVANPQPGLWSFAPVGSSSVEIYMEHAIRTRLRLFMRADVEGGMPILSEPAPGQAFDDGRWAGKPLLIQALPHEGAPIPGAMVNALVTRPDGTTQALPLADDGLHHDGEAGDGLFGALFTNTVIAGTYQIRVVADGTSPASGAPFHREKASTVSLWDADDADGDLMPTWWETLYGTNPNVPDAWADPDQDGVQNATELWFNGRPNLSDSDGGGESDRTEIEQGRNPGDPSDDAIAAPSLAVFPGNNTLIVRTGLTSNRVASVEVQAAVGGPRGTGQMVTLYNDAIPEAGEVILSVPNEVKHCVRARVSVSGVQSGWSPEVCVTPRLDPEPPAAELSLSPRAACVVTPTANVHVDAFEGNPDLRQLLYSDGRASFDPGAIASGVAEMRIAVDSNVDAAAWQPFDSDFTVSLGSAPFVNLGVRVRDAYGNVSDLEVMRIERCPAP